MFHLFIERDFESGGGKKRERRNEGRDKEEEIGEIRG